MFAFSTLHVGQLEGGTRVEGGGELIYPRHSTPMPSPLTVFLIDDDPSVRRALARLIKSAGYQVQTFVSAREFLDRMPDAAGPGCLVLDVRMPGLSGLDLLRELQAADAALHIIFITRPGDSALS